MDTKKQMFKIFIYLLVNLIVLTSFFIVGLLALVKKKIVPNLGVILIPFFEGISFLILLNLLIYIIINRRKR